MSPVPQQRLLTGTLLIVYPKHKLANATTSKGLDIGAKEKNLTQKKCYPHLQG